MRARWIVMAVSAAMALSACGSTGGPPHGGHSSRSTGGPHTGSCRFTTDSVSGSGAMVQIQPPRSPQRTVTSATPMPCDTFLTVGGGGMAQTAFGTQALCAVQQFEPVQVATLVTRDPLDVLFRMANGSLKCTFGTSPRRFRICGSGSVLPGGGSAGTVNCADPFFQVEVRAGTWLVTDPSGATREVVAGSQLRFDFAADEAMPPAAATFSAGDLAVFTAQAAKLGVKLSPLPQLLAITSQPSASNVGDTYTPTATAGGSGNPVFLTVTGGCTVPPDGATVTFTSPGTCSVVAHQDGTADYAPGQSQPQVITVTSTIS
jgi:hypothetical protein